MSQQIEAVFENGVFRPLQPVHLPERHRVTLLLPDSEVEAPTRNGALAEEVDIDQVVSYQPLPLQQCKTVRVRIKHVIELVPPAYPIEEGVDVVDESVQE